MVMGKGSEEGNTATSCADFERTGFCGIYSAALAFYNF